MTMDQWTKSYTSSVFLTALLISILVSSSEANRRCNRPGRYLDSDGKCRRCPIEQRCKIGFTIKESCGYGKELQCVKCREDEGKTCAEGVERTCRMCHKENRVEKHPCTVDNQAECGDCLPGYYKDEWLDECFDCSEDKKNRPECRTTSTTRSTPAKATTESKINPTKVPQKQARHLYVAMTTKQDQVDKAAKTDRHVLEHAWPLMLALVAVFTVILVILIAVYFFKTWGRSCGRGGSNSKEVSQSKKSSSLRMKALADMAVVEDETDPMTSVTLNNTREKRKPSLNTQLSTGPFLLVPGTTEELQFLMASAANSEANSAVSTPSVTPRGLHNQGLSNSNSMTTMEDTMDHSDDVFIENEATEEYNAFQGLQLRLDVEAANPTPLQSVPTIQITTPVDKPKRDRSPVPSTSRDSGKFAGTQTTTFFTAGRHESLQGNAFEPTEDSSDERDPLIEDEQQHLTPTGTTVDEGQDTKYREKLETALSKGKDISLKDGLQSYDIVQRLAQILDQDGVLPTDPSYQNVFQALGVPRDRIDSCHKNKTITSPTLSLLQYLESYAYRYEKHMSDLISVLHRYEFYEAVTYLCAQVINFKHETSDMHTEEQTCES
ncbi:uncharacterized protein LOC118420056 [Branchiostoma floridae]|uniref:Uncharacterized protein LOC118420056 n=1 Tax=Branchiostoma floridae TaxID=7739 RepID=A0A9J7MXP8_BRAFL|nr:uncharacterized protein LOC118420056 [Branchiostoma floridae]